MTCAYCNNILYQFSWGRKDSVHREQIPINFNIYQGLDYKNESVTYQSTQYSSVLAKGIWYALKVDTVVQLGYSGVKTLFTIENFNYSNNYKRIFVQNEIPYISNGIDRVYNIETQSSDHRLSAIKSYFQWCDVTVVWNKMNISNLQNYIEIIIQHLDWKGQWFFCFCQGGTFILQCFKKDNALMYMFRVINLITLQVKEINYKYSYKCLDQRNIQHIVEITKYGLSLPNKLLAKNFDNSFAIQKNQYQCNFFQQFNNKTKQLIVYDKAPKEIVKSDFINAVYTPIGVICRYWYNQYIVYDLKTNSFLEPENKYVGDDCDFLSFISVGGQTYTTSNQYVITIQGLNAIQQLKINNNSAQYSLFVQNNIPYVVADINCITNIITVQKETHILVSFKNYCQWCDKTICWNELDIFSLVNFREQKILRLDEMSISNKYIWENFDVIFRSGGVLLLQAEQYSEYKIINLLNTQSKDIAYESKQYYGILTDWRTDRYWHQHTLQYITDFGLSLDKEVLISLFGTNFIVERNQYEFEFYRKQFQNYPQLQLQSQNTDIQIASNISTYCRSFNYKAIKVIQHYFKNNNANNNVKIISIAKIFYKQRNFKSQIIQILQPKLSKLGEIVTNLKIYSEKLVKLLIVLLQ